MYLQVCTEGRLILEFTFDDLMRIKTWHLAVRAHRELIPRAAVHPPDHAALDALAKNITRQGITNSTLNYLRVSYVRLVLLRIPSDQEQVRVDGALCSTHSSNRCQHKGRGLISGQLSAVVAGTVQTRYRGPGTAAT